MWYEKELDPALLPEPYSTMKFVIGAKKTLKLLELQGRAFYFNSKLAKLASPLSEIIELIGEDATEKLKKHFKNEYLYLNKIDDILRDIRNEKIATEFDGGNYGHLCKKYNLTERNIRYILDDYRKKKFESRFDQISFF